MGDWWRRSDGQPGMSRYGSVAVGVLAAFGVFAWVRLSDPGPLDGDVVASIVAGAIATFFARFDLRERGYRRGLRNAARIRRWSGDLRERRSRRRP